MENENRARTVKVSELPPTLEVSAGLIANRCYKDRDFMEDIKSDAKSAFRHDAKTFYKEHVEDKSMQKKVLSSLSLLDKDEDFPLDIVVCRNTSKKWHIPLPPAGGRKVLSEEELRQIAGGEIIGGLFIASYGAFFSAGVATTTFLGGLVGQTAWFATGATFTMTAALATSATAAVGASLLIGAVAGTAITAAAVGPAIAIGLAVGLS